MLVTIILLFFALQACAEASPVSYQFGGENRQALICRPEGKGPFPAVVYNHGRIVDMEGIAGASERGYDLDGICRSLAKGGFLALAPIRDRGRGNIPGHKNEVSRAVDYVKILPDVDPSRVALMGFSRGVS
jgi:dienelactone hydrolase